MPSNFYEYFRHETFGSEDCSKIAKFWSKITSVWCKSRLVRTCKETLRTFGADRIRLCRVPSHSKILGSKTADVFPKLGSLSGGDLVVGLDPPIWHLYGLINGLIRGEEQRFWGNGTSCCVSRCVWHAINSMRTRVRPV